jgi:hypothetical protein
MFDHNASARLAQFGDLRRVLVVVLAVTAILVGLFSLHNMAEMPPGLGASEAHATPSVAVEGSAGNLAVTAVAGSATSASTNLFGLTSPGVACDSGCAVGCALMVAGCSILLILVVLVFLTRYPASFTRLRDSGRHLLELIPEARGHAYAPSLTLLSISRI